MIVIIEGMKYAEKDDKKYRITASFHNVYSSTVNLKIVCKYLESDGVDEKIIHIENDGKDIFLSSKHDWGY